MPGLSRRHLIHLYPRAWRKRYGQEFALLLEAAPLSTRTVANIAAAAGREWLVRTLTGRLLLGPAVAYGALMIAQVLSTTVVVDPALSFENGVRLVSPPWPVRLGFLQPLLGLAVLARFAAGFRRRLPMSGSELACWVAALTGASICWQWGAMIGNLGTGINPWSPLVIWTTAALVSTSHLVMLLAGSRSVIRPKKAAQPYTGSSRPLGLS